MCAHYLHPISSARSPESQSRLPVDVACTLYYRKRILDFYKYFSTAVFPHKGNDCVCKPSQKCRQLWKKQRCDVTFISAVTLQHALRLSAFGQIYKVLEMDPLPSNKSFQKYSWSVADKEGRYCLLQKLLIYR